MSDPHPPHEAGSDEPGDASGTGRSGPVPAPRPPVAPSGAAAPGNVPLHPYGPPPWQPPPAYGAAPPLPPTSGGPGAPRPAGHGPTAPPAHPTQPTQTWGPGYASFGPVTNQKAAWALGTAVVSLFVACCAGPLGLLGVVAIVLAVKARGEIAASAGQQRGDGMAVAGFVVGIVAVVGAVLVSLLLALVLATPSG